MKKHIIITAGAALMALTACSDWLEEPSPGVTKLDDYFSGADAATQNVNGCYAPLQWEYNKTFYPEWFIGDVVSDDALKGGQNTNDMADAYDMENWKTMPNNTLLLDFYRNQFQGIARCNLSIHYVSQMETDETLTLRLRDRLLAEAHFLRAYYYFRLVRVFGGVPIVDFVVDSDKNWNIPRSEASEVYKFIKEDLIFAQSRLPEKRSYDSSDMGRATKGAAEAMLLKTNLYTHDYEAARQWGDSVISKGQYTLCSNYADNFTLEGENGPESVFEIQYSEDPTSDYGEGNGFTRGCFDVIMTRSRSEALGGGWGFNHPTQNLYDEYEHDDIRRDVTILNPTDEQIKNPAQEIYLGSRYHNRKYGMYTSDDNSLYYKLMHPTRGPINNKQIRYADVLLMYAEACAETGKEAEAIDALNQVRGRAMMADYPGYKFCINGEEVANPTLKQAIRHERRVELAMEGHRWFDLCRWGVAKETMDAYKATESDEAQAQMAEFIKGKHELFPIPSDELDLNSALEQNPGY